MGFDGAGLPSVGTRSANIPGDKHKARKLIGRGLGETENPVEIVKFRKRL